MGFLCNVHSFCCVGSPVDKAQHADDAGENVDLYIPRKCSASNRIIYAKDHASIQMNIAEVDEKTGMALPSSKTYAICGSIRRMGESDDCINRLANKDGVLAKNFK